MKLCEAAAYYKTKNMTLWDAMLAMYDRYGYYKDDVKAVSFQGREGIMKIQSIMKSLRQMPPERVGDYMVTAVRDYKNNTITDVNSGEVKETGLPISDVLYFDMSDNAWLCVRPSGTEPKVKFYYGVTGSSLEDADKKSAELAKEVMKIIDNVLQ